MIGSLRKHMESMGTIKTLCELAEKHALREEKREPGAEHFLLAAIDLPDGTAKSSFAKIGVDASALQDAIQRQYGDALQHLGLDPQTLPQPTVQEEAVGEGHGAYRAAPSGKHVMQALATNRDDHSPLLGAHVVAVVADMEHGVAARALDVMGVERTALKRAAEDLTRTYRG